jgi:uncharacterized integral membrane protein
MRARVLLVVVAVLLMAVFVGVNWAVFMTPAPLNLLVTTVEAPPALVMLAVLGGVVLVGAVYMAVWQSQILLESRRHAKDLQAQRLLADQAEASRFTELRTVMLEQMERLSQRLTVTQEALRAEMRDNTASLAATIGKADDRSRSGLPRS